MFDYDTIVQKSRAYNVQLEPLYVPLPLDEQPQPQPQPIPHKWSALWLTLAGRAARARQSSQVRAEPSRPATAK